MMDYQERAAVLERLKPILKAFREAQRLNPRLSIERAIPALEKAWDELVGKQAH